MVRAAIPHARGHKLLFNSGRAIQGLVDIARHYPDIVEVSVASRKLVVVYGSELVDEICDDTRFDKLSRIRANGRESIAGDGLFSAWTYEPNWAKAHRILLPNFSQSAMRRYMPAMVDVAQQLVEKWERLNPGEDVDIPADMTRVTMETIGMCGFGYRFNSFYRDEPHPFVAAVGRAMEESQARMSRLPGQSAVMLRKARQFQEDTTTLFAMVDQLIRDRRAQEDSSQTDLLGCMLNGVDQKTGEALDDLNIRYQCLTFLIAGHDSTSGLLSSAIYALLNNPRAAPISS